MLLVLIGGMWSLVTQIITLAEVQRFSIPRAIASIAVVMIPVVLLGML